MSKHWPEVIEGRIATKNKMGFMFTEINGASRDFLEACKGLNGIIIDLGCAYGIVTAEVLKNSKSKVIAFDLSQEHLDILRSSLSAADAKKVTTVQGRFPHDFVIDDNTVNAIHSSYMFHFLNPADTQAGLAKCFSALKYSGPQI